MLFRSTVIENGGQRIGIVGLTTSDTPITSSPGPTVAFRDEAAALADGGDPYDALLDDYEQGMTGAEIAALFDTMRPRLVALREDVLGAIYYYDSTRVNLGLFQRDVNVIWDLAVHDLAILDHLLDQRPVAISASSAGFLAGRPDNMAQLNIHYGNGALAHLNVNWLAPVKIRQTLIGGSRKMVLYDDMQTSEKLRVYDRGASCGSGPYEHLVSYRIGDMYAPALSSKEALLTEVEIFADCIQQGNAPATDGLAGLRIVEMLAAATRSTELRGHPIDLVNLKVAS
mgnify:CR=1 FL=1